MNEIISVKLQGNCGYLLNGTVHVPNAPGNKEYQMIQDWIALGNVPDPEFTATELLEQNKQSLTTAVQSHLDQMARTKGYDSILSACSYAGYTNQFQAEAITFLQWRSNCWTTCYQVLADVNAGTRTIPTADQLITELPVIVV